MKFGRASLSAILAVSLAACGGGGGNSSGGGTPIAGGGSGGGGTGTCSLSSRQDFVKAVIDEWYLFPTLVDNSVNKSSFNDVQSYIDALVAPARAQSRDRFFSYITSIEEENAFFNSGSSAGFGIRLGYDTGANRVFVIESFETGPAFPQGFDRGTELIAVGTNAGNLQSISSLMASGGPQAVIDALGPSDPGVTRSFVIRPVGGADTTVTVSKADFSLDPVSNRYGAQIINDGGKLVGYINLRTFIDSADPDLRAAFDNFRQQGVTEVILDLRYNGGGLVRIAELFGDLLRRDNVGDVFSRTTLRASKSSENSTDLFGAQPQAITATKIAVIGRPGTASASELVTNSMIPYLGNNIALVGSNTFGKPVGQFAFDKAECDDRLRVVTFRTENSDGQGDYYTGLASVMPNTCAASDDIFTQLGDPNEASVAQALAFLRTGAASCSAISGGGQATQSRTAGSPQRQLLQPRYPTAAQHEVPGLF
uniref:S41 family peptidase n=1 Tax=Parerythrobacter lutipelagi TaxID=1964208 RepID=UPI0010F8B13B|nr:S41 family peptidase [Parerythrobacter lutipelagi]